MPNVIHVLKPFMFSYPATEGQRLTKEKFFPKGQHEVDDIVYNHPFISVQFAEGRIERPEQTKARLAAHLAKLAEDNAEAAVQTAAANAAFARLKAAEPGAKASTAEIEAELNTPVSELKARQGVETAATVATLQLKGKKSA